MMRADCIIRLLLATVGLSLVGCMSVVDPTKYYVLSAHSATESHEPTSTADSSPAVGVGPVLIPGYLDRLQIVTRSASGEVDIAKYERWAEPLESGVAQVLADKLGAYVGSERIAVFPWRGGVARVLDYQVVVAVVRFEGWPARQATLDARWRILGKDGKELVLKRSIINETIDEPGYQPLVQGMSRLLSTLASEIASEIRSRAAARAPEGHIISRSSRGVEGDCSKASRTGSAACRSAAP
jgi:uncharacterized lipoprotein YmbA